MAELWFGALPPVMSASGNTQLWERTPERLYFLKPDDYETLRCGFLIRPGVVP